MNDRELDELLKSAQPPARPDAYWRDFPKRVSAELYWQPKSERPDLRRVDSLLAWGLGLATACLAIFFVIHPQPPQEVSPQARSGPASDEQLAEARKCYRAEDKVLTVAVFDFESRDEGAHDLGAKVSALLNASLSAEPGVITVERAELEKALGEQELGLSGNVSPDTAAKVGHLTGAQVLVTGRVFRVEKDLYLVAKIIGSETSRVYGELVKAPAENSDLAELTASLAKKISRDLAEKSDTLVAKAETREQRIAKIVAAVKDGPHPSVTVVITERHFGGPVIDPAAQTELSLILQKAGFTVVDEKSDAKPDVEISGEAFSAVGLRKGNLVSCRSRIELKAHDRKTGKILAVDSQTSVAVDTAEQIAGKTALENAADQIAARIVPKLAGK